MTVLPDLLHSLFCVKFQIILTSLCGIIAIYNVHHFFWTQCIFCVEHVECLSVDAGALVTMMTISFLRTLHGCV